MMGRSDILREAAVIVVIVAIIATFWVTNQRAAPPAADFRTPSAPDELSAELRRCGAPGPQDAEDLRCVAVFWEENRRRFFGRAGVAVSPRGCASQRIDRKFEAATGRGAMANFGVIDTFFNTFTTYIDSGLGRIKGDVAYLSSTLIVIDITLAGIFWAWGADEDILQRLVKKTLYIGFIALIINNFNNLSAIIFNSFVGLGLKAGSTIRPPPSCNLATSRRWASPASSPISFRSPWLLVLIAFLMLAVQLFVTLVEFKLTTLAEFILTPFALFNKTGEGRAAGVGSRLRVTKHPSASCNRLSAPDQIRSVTSMKDAGELFLQAD